MRSHAIVRVFIGTLSHTGIRLQVSRMQNSMVRLLPDRVLVVPSLYENTHTLGTASAYTTDVGYSFTVMSASA